MNRGGRSGPAGTPVTLAAVLAAMLAVLAIAAAGPVGAQDHGCRCAGLGAVDLSGTGHGSGTALDYRPPATAGDPAVAATIRLSCRADGVNRHCHAEVDATVSGNGSSRVGSGSGSASAPVDACLIVGQALQAAWREAVGPDLAVQGPGPCS